MKAILFVGIVIFVSSFAPHSFSMKADDELRQTTTPVGKWILIPAAPSDTATGKIPSLTFDMKSKRVIGNTGCNSFSGTFIINKNALSFRNDFMSTKMACPGYDEKAFELNLMRTNNFTIHGDTLCLQVDQIPLSYWVKRTFNTKEQI